VRLIVCSNSAPRWQEDVGLLPRSPGGLVPLLVTLMRDGGDWVCTAPSGGPSASPGGLLTTQPGDAPVWVTPLPGGVTLHQVRQPAAVIEQHYEIIGVRLLLWLFHYLLDTSRQPAFDGHFVEAWAGFEAVNRAYASHLAPMLANSADELVLINDYHLFLLPEMLRQGGGAAHRSQVAFFHGLPWCEPDYFGILPAAIRDRILTSLLRCDIVGFHAARWARAFAACCARYLPGCDVTDDGVVSGTHRTRLVVAPFPLDAGVLERMRDEAATGQWRERLGQAADGRQMIVRADRMDLWKNLPRGFAAYQSLLERKPGLAREWWFCAVATTPSRTTERSRDLQRWCEDKVASLNEQFGAPGRPAVSLVYPDLATTRNCVVAALSQSDLTLVNPTFDGMNLVAKEALYLGERAPLLLSVNAGAYEQLADYVAPLQPFDVQATATAMADAMTGMVPARQQPAQALLRGQDAAGWLAKLAGSADPVTRTPA
jgi:trehalose 6-phosphate synthase